MNDPRPDPPRLPVVIRGLQRCPGCRRSLDPATRQRWVSEGVVFFVCTECRLRAKSNAVFMDRMFHGVANWVEMNALLAKYRKGHADVL